MVLAVSRSVERERQAAVNAEGAHPGGRRGGHAEPAVVVDARGAEGQPGELAQHVGLLVGEAAAAENADGVLAVACLRVLHGGGDQGQGLVPADGAVDAVGALQERLGDASGVVQERG